MNGSREMSIIIITVLTVTHVMLIFIFGSTFVTFVYKHSIFMLTTFSFSRKITNSMVHKVTTVFNGHHIMIHYRSTKSLDPEKLTADLEKMTCSILDTFDDPDEAFRYVDVSI